MIPHDTTAIPHGSCSPTTGIIKTVQTLQFVLQKPRHRTSNPPNLISNHTRWSHHVPCIVFFHFAMCPYTLQYTPQCFFYTIPWCSICVRVAVPQLFSSFLLISGFFRLGKPTFSQRETAPGCWSSARGSDSRAIRPRNSWASAPVITHRWVPRGLGDFIDFNTALKPSPTSLGVL